MAMDKHAIEARRARQEQLELHPAGDDCPLVRATPESVPPLQNGAKLLGCYWMLDHWAILAFAEGDPNPFTCWHMDERGYCYWGHYFNNLNDATHHWVHNMVGV